MVIQLCLDELDSKILLVISRKNSSEEEVFLKICESDENEYERNKIFNSLIKLVNNEYLDLTRGPNDLYFYSVKKK